MAIDTAAKRKAALNVTSFSGPGVTPDGTPGVEWRQQVAHSYSGIAPAAPGGGAPMGAISMYFHLQGMR
jgi:hypothetical protein